MKRTYFYALGMMFVFGCSAVRGEDAQNPNALNEIAEVVSVGDQIDEAFNTFASKKSITYGSSDASGRIFYKGVETVAVPPENAQWGKQRVSAFEKALLKAQAEFVRDRFGKQMVQQARTMFEDMSDNAEEFPEGQKGRLEVIWEKLLALTDAKLNKKLEEVGVDPEEYKSASPKQRKKLFSDAYTKKCLTKAIGDMSGLLPVQTFEANDGKGTYKIGVVLLYSSKVKQLAYDISHNRLPLLTGRPGKSLNEIVPVSSEVLANQFGVRVLFNEQGQPCLVSYGQWSHNYTGNDERMRERRNESSMMKAKELADSYITTFLSSKMFYENEQETGELLEESVAKDSDGNVTYENISNVIDKINQKIKVEAKADMAGRGTFRSVKYKHPVGHEISIVARVWTMQNLKTTKGVQSWKPESQSTQSGGSAVTGEKESSGVKSGQDVDFDDF
jgi:hypothetical protein